MKKQWLFLFFLISFNLNAQTVPPSDTTDATDTAITSIEIKGYASYELGMSMDQVKEIYKKDPSFIYTPDPEVSLQARENQTMMEIFGRGFIKRAFFQFYENKLYSLILVLDTEKVDFYSVRISLEKKYGTFSLFSPQKVEWTADTKTLSLEKPLSVKYLDTSVIETIAAGSSLSEDMEALTLEKFLEKL